MLRFLATPLRSVARCSLLAVSSGLLVSGALWAQAPERVQLPGTPSLDRTTTDESAPDFPDLCGTDDINEFDLPVSGRKYVPDTVTFSLQIRDELSPYRLMSFFLLPREEIEIEAVFANKVSRFTACADSGEIRRIDADQWTWTAPEAPGLSILHVTDTVTDETVRVHLFVMNPYAGQDVFEGYRIGAYETVPLKGDPNYRVPEGLFAVDESLLETWVSPHFQLRQFLCKQKTSGPRFVLVQTRLLLKLEWLLEQVNLQGIETDTFAVLSAYRTPHYNRAIGNKTRYSRHLYGDAADIYIDRDANGRMDDLNGDGKSDLADAKILARIIDQSYGKVWYRPFVGGMGLYGPKPHRGPFVHVDTRGFKARW